jgi:hypothetical protein
MKKTILGLSLMASSLLFGAESYTQFMGTAINDANDIHNYSKSRMEKLANSDSELQTYTKKLEAYEAKVSKFLENQAKENFASKADGQKALNELEHLSSQNVVLAKTVAYLASHQADNANESYNNTIQTTSKTILRLSDDIGLMADRILLMAKQIGIMADRIVKTQEIQSKNLIATQKLAHYAMSLTDGQVTATRKAMQKNMPSTSNGMNQMGQINQMMQQPASQTVPMSTQSTQPVEQNTIPMH